MALPVGTFAPSLSPGSSAGSGVGPFGGEFFGGNIYLPADSPMGNSQFPWTAVILALVGVASLELMRRKR